MRRAIALLVLVSALAAGCVAAPAEDADTAALPPLFLDPIVEDHDHADPQAHDLPPLRMEKLGYSHLGDEAASFAHFGEMDFHGTLMVVAAARMPEAKPALVTVDLTDPANPVRLGWAMVTTQPPVGLLDNPYPLDVKLDEKGEFAYLSVYTQIHAFDVRDPANPKPAGVMTPPGVACHMSAMGVVGGAEYFWCTGDPVGLTAYRVVEAGERRALVPVGYARPSDPRPVTGAGTFGALGAPHDMTFQLDPVDGTPLLVVSNRGYGIRVLDVSVPSLPREIGAWRGEGADQTVLHMHTAMVTVVNGTRYLIGSPEILVDGEPPAIWILDATDYADLQLAAEWVGPGAHPSPGGFTFTTHQWQVADGRLYLGYYHAGVWVLDLATILAGGYEDDPARPDVLGYILPDEAPVEAGAMVPNVWDLNLRHGVVYATDINSGLYALHYLPDPIGDETLTGFS